MDSLEDIERKVNELSTNYKLLEFQSKFENFRTMVVSGFTVFCLMFAAFFGYNYTEIPNRINHTLEEKMGKQVIERLKEASNNADKVLSAQGTINSLNEKIKNIEQEIEKYRKILPVAYSTNLDKLKNYNAKCTDETIYLPACDVATHKFCYEKTKNPQSLGIIKEENKGAVIIVCVNGMTNN